MNGATVDHRASRRPVPVDRLSGSRREGRRERLRRSDQRQDLARRGVDRAVVRDGPHELALDPQDDRVDRLAEPRGPLRDDVEHRLDVGRRARDDPQDLGRRRLVLERLGELARPVLDLLLEGGVRLVELGRHAVELVGEPLELVAGLHVDPLVERARADPRRARLERVDRGRHAPRQEEARQDRQRDADEEEPDGAVGGRVEGRERLAERLLDEDPPAERRDRRRRRQDLAPCRSPGRR